MSGILFAQDALDRSQEVNEVVWFAYKILRSVLLRFNGVLEIGEAGQHDNFYLGIPLLDVLQNFESIHLRHLDVEEHEVEFLILDRGDRRLAVRSSRDVVPCTGKLVAQHRAQRIFVVDNQDVTLVSHTEYLRKDSSTKCVSFERLER